MDKENTYALYQRQILLKELGMKGQDKLLSSSVLVIGAGGLGCPALLYLAAAGVGRIGIVDGDKVDISNLHRQVLYGAEDVGQVKAMCAAGKLKKTNPGLVYDVYDHFLSNKNALDLLKHYDVIIDASDNFATRYMVNDACVMLDKPLVYGAVLRFEGQLAVFNVKGEETRQITNYRDLFPHPPNPATVVSCNEAGVLGVIPGIIGTMQALEAIKLLTGIGRPLLNKLLSFNGLSNTFYETEVQATFTKEMSPQEFARFDYEYYCSSTDRTNEISVEEFEALIKRERLTIIDVREKNELPKVEAFPNICIPLQQFKTMLLSIDATDEMVIFCQSGRRSAEAVIALLEARPQCRARSLRGGIEAWKKH